MKLLDTKNTDVADLVAAIREITGRLGDVEDRLGELTNVVVDLAAKASCADCGTDTLSPLGAEYYMVRDDVWQAARAPGRGHLCIGCLEERLDRELTAADFTDAEVNEPGPRNTRRLNNRLAIMP